MAKYINRFQLSKATDEEIETFFENTVFHGTYSSEIKSKHTDYYKGSVSDITLEGRLTKLCPAFLNVPINSNDIEEGPCEFKVRLNLEAFREEKSRYIVNLRGNTLQRSYNEVEIIAPKDSTDQELFEWWGVEDTQFIGYYHHDDESDVNIVDDIRKVNFDHIPFYPGDKDKKPIRLSFPFDLWGLKKDNYYLFNWKLSHRNKYNPYEILIDLDKKPKKIDPKWFIDTLFDDRYNDKSKNFGSATNFLDTLSKQLSAKESTFVYELLQNANDYPVEGQLVDVEFHITDNYLLFLHSGDKFNVRNISGICGINEKEKTANKKAIGYKGIGFKTVFLNNHYVYIRTGRYSFRFDEHAKKIRRLLAPWPILPVWTDHAEVEPEVNNIFDKDPKHFQVQIALRPDSKNLLHAGKNSYENLFKDVFSDSNIILFIPNINSVKVFINEEEVRTCYRNNEEWVVRDYEEEIDDDLQALINRTIETGRSRIPEKYKDFEATKVSYACKHEGSIIKKIDDGTLYCYLPTKASWGFPFLMNTDMIPKGDRNDIETEVKLLDEDETNFNEELAAVAGSKLYDWIYDLLVSKTYHYGSIFSLIPNFDKCIKEHREYRPYIEKFQDAFEEQLANKAIVPIFKSIAKVSEVILDDTGLSSSGIMSDDEFYEFAGFDEGNRLPIPMLRKDKNFRIFHKRYVDDSNIFDIDSLHKMIGNEKFQEWLKVQENNDKFLNFLLEKDYLADFFDEEIFIEQESGDLYDADSLYYDVDDELQDLSAFSNHICYLSLKTRDYFKDNEEWEESRSESFIKFDSEKFVLETLLSSNRSETIERLGDWETSSHFYNFISRKKIVDDDIAELPFFNDDEEPSLIDNFNEGFVFFASKKGQETFAANWLSEVTVAFVSSKYNKDVQKYFEDNLGVRNFEDSIVVKEIILSDDYSDDINKRQQEKYDDSEAFLKYCFLHKDMFDAGSLENYALSAVDKNGDYDYILSEDHIYFPSSTYDEYCSKEWIDNGWMYCLDSDYLKGYSESEQEELKAFIHKAFYVDEIDAKEFYKYIVRKHISDIIANTSGDNDSDGSKNVDLISYLDDNYKLIFEEEKEEELFEDIVLFTENGIDIDADSSHIYAYDDELKEIIESEWFPDNVVYMCSHRYGDSKAILKIKAEKYKFSSFFDDVITEELDSINECIDTKEKSVAFHNLIIANRSELTDTQKEVMKGAKLYLYGSDEACDTSDGHKILSSKARELFNEHLVEFADLDIIDPDYKPEANVDYWEARLGNSKFTVADFTKWLVDNSDTFVDTISDKDLNISFWRWVKDNISDSTLERIPKLPVFLTDDSIAYAGDVIYLSDAYISEGGIETIVKKYHDDAAFICADYIEENGDVEAWKTFWTKVGMLSDIVDILVNTIIPRLDEIDDEKLPATLVKYRKELEEEFEDLPNALSTLHVKAHDGNFYPISETIYINSEKEEPFKYIELPNQITFETADERKLIKDIIDSIDGCCLEKLQDWQEAKIEQYLEYQKDEDSTETLRSIHFLFIDELASMYNVDRDSLNDFENLNDILLLDKDDEFCDASSLTLGSLYHPFCDFEKYNVGLRYLSDAYRNECVNDIRKMLNRKFKVHSDFKKTDVRYLAQRDFAIYFWTEYLKKKDADISGVKSLMEDGEFDNISCIPTKDFMKKPSEVYSISITSYVKNNVEDWENKLPLNSIPKIEYAKDEFLFGLLDFKAKLDFLDALYALFKIADSVRRKIIITWMIDQYEEKYDAQIEAYREDEGATWFNTKNEPVQIKKLYALEAGSKMLEQYFGNLPQIINTDYLPEGEKFEEACDILKIKVIKPDELIVEPENKEITNNSVKKDLLIFALVIAGSEDSENWAERYNNYKERLKELNFWRCSAISLHYSEDEDICQKYKKFYHDEGSTEFYYVKSLNDKRVFQPFVENYVDYLGIEAENDFIEAVMDDVESAVETVKDNNDLMLDNDFKDELDKLIPGIKRELNGNEADEGDIEEGVDTRHTFSAYEKEEAEDEEIADVPESEDEPMSQNDEYETEDNTGDSTHLQTRQPRSDQGSTHDYHRTREHHEENHEKTAPESKQTSSSSTQHEQPHRAQESDHPYTDNRGWADRKRSNIGLEPKPFSPEDVRNFGSNGKPRSLDVLEPTQPEVDDINRILDGDLSPEQVADQNYLAQLRLYRNLKKRGMEPEESEEDFVRNGHLKNEHTLHGGKYIHKCSAAGGIMYLSPSIWNKIADDKCVVCVYLGAKANDFMYFNSIEEILDWIREDDIVIKLTGEEKADVVQELYSGILYGVKGTAYTMIRLASNEKYNSLFAPLAEDPTAEHTEDEEEY